MNSENESGAAVQVQLGGDLREGTREYNTPLEWVAPVAEALDGFDLDPCASADSNLAAENIRETGGLEAEWYGTVWCNHPYGRGQPPRWVRKASECDAETVVTLSKADPSADWFHDYLLDADLLCFPAQRIGFVGEDNSAKFPNVYGVFGHYPAELRRVFENWGWVVSP